jgi:hypothetical protein
MKPIQVWAGMPSSKNQPAGKPIAFILNDPYNCPSPASPARLLVGGDAESFSCHA